MNPFETTFDQDDSGSSLLQSRNDGKEGKKIPGKLAYHKPGPPTPSKNSGRVSIGNEELPTGGAVKEEPKKKSSHRLWASSRVKDEVIAPILFCTFLIAHFLKGTWTRNTF